MSQLPKLKNFGAKTTQWLEDIGITSLEQIEELGVIEVYRRLKETYPHKVSLNALWGLQGAVMGISYTQIPAEIKEELLKELEKKHS